MMIKEHIDLNPYTYFKIGGSARYFIDVKNIAELKEAIKFAKDKKIDFTIIGAASNILVSDNGYDGLIIRILLREIKREGNNLDIDAGVPNALAVRKTIDEKLTGLEWAIGIPGTIGGSIRGNAGCFGGEIKDVLTRVSFLDTRSGKYEEQDNNFCRFGYRDSVFKHSPHLVIVSGTFVLKEGDGDAIQKMVRHYTSLRSEEQDIGKSSAGCVFKNVPWPTEKAGKDHLIWLTPELAQFKDRPTIPTGFLVDYLGLKGKRIGRVSISKKHGNYFINEGGATAEEVIMLIGLVKEYVHRKFGLHPEEEIQYIGF